MMDKNTPFEIELDSVLEPTPDGFMSTTDGCVKVEMSDGQVVTFTVSAGQWHPFYIKRVFSEGTYKHLSLKNLFVKQRVFGIFDRLSSRRED